MGSHGGPLYRFKLWMYPRNRPNLLARLLNRISEIQFSRGLAPRNWMTLEVRGRSTGRLLSLPVVVADHEGERYLVSMLGQTSGWVRNVRAAQGHAVLRRGHQEKVLLEEVEVAERPPILRRYLELAPGARPHIPVDRRAPLEDFAAIAEDYPVFRVVSR